MSTLLDPSPSSTPPEIDWADLEIDEETHVAHVSLVATGKGSRQGPDFWTEMPALFGWLDASDQVRAVVLKGQGQSFSLGLDLIAMAPMLASLLGAPPGARERMELHRLIEQMQRATSAVARCSKPVIAAIHGYCIGAGVDLASACDIRLAAEDAIFSVREVRLAIVADVGSLARLPGIIGQSATRELALTGDDIGADRALELGLVSRVLPSPEALFEEARAMAERIANNPPLTVQGIKRVLNMESERAAQRSLEQVASWNAAFLPSKDLAEAVQAFAEKRDPEFRGE